MHSLLGSVLWLLVVLAAIPVSLWLLKRSPLGAGLGAQGTAHLQTVSSLMLGNGQRLVTVEVREGTARRWLVLGVTPHSITPVHTMDAPPTPEPGPGRTGGEPGFAGLLQRLRAPGSHE